MARAEQPLKCPSAQPGMGDVQILGVISRDAEARRGWPISRRGYAGRT